MVKVMSLRVVVMMMVVVVTIMMMEGEVEGAVDYECVFGSMFSVEENGVTHHFCSLGMNPPFMDRGQYVIAQNSAGVCYECICEDDIGKACCEISCSL
ncbi:uncharacterized protein LOC143276239 isoform X1 [Babylonia areolata]|uniref:uncharacterized protein LOC143276239 isoform X1 n=1 Tax=Babylonia areolata TaxID=304850 RepID=UPI003FD56494